MKELLKKFGFKDLFYILVIGVLVFFGWRMYVSLQEEVAASKISFKQLSDTVVRAQNEVVTKAELDKFARSIDSELKKSMRDIKTLGAELKAVGVTIASLEGIVKEGADSSSTVGDDDVPEQPETCELCDVHGYTKKIESIEFGWDDFSLGKCVFRASQEKPWSLIVDPIDVQVSTVVGEKENSTTFFYHTITMINKKLNKKHKLKVTSSEYKETKDTTKEFYWWAPQIDFNLDNNLFPARKENFYKFGGSIGFSAMGYGNNTADLDWRFLHVGAGLHTNTAYVTITPVKYNIGKNIILFNDLWLGLGVSYNQDFGVNLSIGTRL